MPKDKPYIYQLRMPRSLEKRVHERADREGVSVNQYILYVLTMDVGEGHGRAEVAGSGMEIDTKSSV